MKNIAKTILILATVLLTNAAIVFGQTEPEAPRKPEKLYNGFQIAFYAGASYNHLIGEYHGAGPSDFVGNTSSFSMPFGGWLNIPLFADAALYLRAGVHNTSTDWLTGRYDSLRSVDDYDVVLSNWTFEYNLFNIDVLLRLIGEHDGERIYIGPSFSVVNRKHVFIEDTEYLTDATYVMEDGEMLVDQSVRTSIIIGAEYAFIPLKNLYVIPALEVDYPFEKLYRGGKDRPYFRLRPIFYKFVLSISYQLF